MPHCIIRWLACFCLSIVVSPLSAQAPMTVKVEAPTRIDWQFAASAFAKGTALPADYDSTEQRYQLFVPKEYSKEKSWPLVVFMSPTDQPAGWNAWKNVCVSEGILFCSPFKAGNNTPVGQRTRIVLDMFDDVRRHYNIDPDQTYLGGMSGGGRMACSIGFRLPEYFGGIIPVCGTNPLPNLAYIRHNIHDRLSIAFVTGETDFNRKENEDYMYPFFQDLGFRSKLWIPKVGHTLPPSAVVEEVQAWLKADLKRRMEYRRDYPGLSVTSDNGPAAKEQAAGLLRAAEVELKKPGRQWHALAMLQGVERAGESSNRVKKLLLF